MIKSGVKVMQPYLVFVYLKVDLKLAYKNDYMLTGWLQFSLFLLHISDFNAYCYKRFVDLNRIIIFFVIIYLPISINIFLQKLDI